MNDNKKGGFLTGLMLGALLGGAAYYVFGTEKGRKLQKDLKKLAKPYLNDLSDIVDQWPVEKEKIIERMEDIKEAIEEKVEEGVTSVPRLEELQERSKAITKRFFKNIKKSSNNNAN